MTITKTKRQRRSVKEFRVMIIIIYRRRPDGKIRKSRYERTGGGSRPPGDDDDHGCIHFLPEGEVLGSVPPSSSPPPEPLPPPPPPAAPLLSSVWRWGVRAESVNRCETTPHTHIYRGLGPCFAPLPLRTFVRTNTRHTVRSFLLTPTLFLTSRCRR